MEMSDEEVIRGGVAFQSCVESDREMDAILAIKVDEISRARVKKSYEKGRKKGIQEEREKLANKLREKISCIHVDHKTCPFSKDEICEKLRDWCIELQEFETELLKEYENDEQ